MFQRYADFIFLVLAMGLGTAFFHNRIYCGYWLENVYGSTEKAPKTVNIFKKSLLN
jgi:hypothetical protein